MTTRGERFRGTENYRVVRDTLIQAAAAGTLVPYKTVAKLLGIDGYGYQYSEPISQLLGEISEDENAAGRPMLSAVAVNEGRIPGSGFFTLARRLSRLITSGQEAEHSFWHSERRRLQDTWKADLADRNTTIRG